DDCAFPDASKRAGSASAPQPLPCAAARLAALSGSSGSPCWHGGAIDNGSRHTANIRALPATAIVSIIPAYPSHLTFFLKEAAGIIGGPQRERQSEIHAPPTKS